MTKKLLKPLLVATFSAFLLLFSYNVKAEENEHATAEEHGTEKKEGFNAKEIIFEHIMDAYEFHFLNYKGSDGKEHALSIPLPVILYSPGKGPFCVYVFGI